MPERLPEEVARLLTEFVEKTGLLRRELQHNQDLTRYEGRVARIEQKLLALAAVLEATDPDLAKSLRDAWALPGRTLAFRNAAHQRRD